MPNPENLKKRKPFVKNDPRINKAGRPKLPDLKEVMSEVLGKQDGGKTALKSLLETVYKLAKKGNTKAIEILLSRGYGMPKQEIEQHNTGDQTIHVTRTVISKKV